jgi:endonuclease YncB( thermonuclease family)
MNLFLCILFFLFVPLQVQTSAGQVVAIADGDTLTVLTEAKEQVKVRINGIDAPERKQPYSQASKENLSRLVFGRIVTVESSKKDRYGRTVGKVLIDGVDVGLEQVKSGYAWHFKRYEREQSQADRAAYANAEEQARSKRLGLWRDDAPVPPWDYRAERRR